MNGEKQATLTSELSDNVEALTAQLMPDPYEDNSDDNKSTSKNDDQS